MPLNLKPPALDLEVAGDLQIAIEDTLERMFGIKVAYAFESFDRSGAISSGDVYGSVSIISERYLGSLVLSYPKETLFQILSGFYKREFTSIDKSATQLVGELTNIIFGVFKHRLNQKGFAVKMAIPVVITDATHRVPGAMWLLECRVSSRAGPFCVYIARAERLET